MREKLFLYYVTCAPVETVLVGEQQRNPSASKGWFEWKVWKDAVDYFY